jgi:hypothetical protein
MMARGELTNPADDYVPWVTIGSAGVAICSFLILMGMWLGPQKDVPQTLVKITSQLQEIYTRMDKNAWAIESLKTQVDGLTVSNSVGEKDRNKLREDLRDLKTLVTQLETTAVTREILLEWKADFEQRNRNLSTPPLPKAK